MIPSSRNDPPRPPPGTPAHAAALRVLVVEDDEGLRFLTAAALAQIDASLEIVGVADGDAALDALAHQAFDVVLIDQYLPRRLGTEVFALARARGYTMPFVLVTGADDAVAVARNAHVEHVLEKPFGPEVLRRVLRAALPTWQPATP